MRKPGSWLKAFGFLFGLSLLGWLISDAIEQSQSVTWPPIPVGYVAIAFAMVLVARCLHATAWAVGAREVAPEINWISGVATYSVAFLGRYVPGKIWQVGGLVYFARQHGANAIDIGVFSIVFLVIYQLSGGIMVLLAMVSQDLRFSAMIIVLGTMVVTLTITLFWHRYAKHIVHLAPARFAHYANGAFKQPTRASVIMITLMVVTWVLLATSGYVLTKGFQPTWAGTWDQSTVAILGSIMVGFLVFIAPSGIGVREGMMLVLLEAVGVNHISAFLVIVSHRLIMVAAEIAWGVAGMIILAARPASEPST